MVQSDVGKAQHGPLLLPKRKKQTPNLENPAQRLSPAAGATPELFEPSITLAVDGTCATEDNKAVIKQ